MPIKLSKLLAAIDPDASGEWSLVYEDDLEVIRIGHSGSTVSRQCKKVISNKELERALTPRSTT